MDSLTNENFVLLLCGLLLILIPLTIWGIRIERAKGRKRQEDLEKISREFEEMIGEFESIQKAKIEAVKEQIKRLKKNEFHR